MAVGTGNPFYIEPAKADISPVLQGIGSMIKESRESKLKQENQDALMTAYKGGNPDDVAALIAKSPELAGSLNTMLKFKSDKTAKGFGDTVRGIALDPDNAEQILIDRINSVNESGGNPVQSVMALDQFRRDPEGFSNSLLLMGAGTLNPQEYDALKIKMGAGKDSFKQQSLQLKRDTLGLRKLEAALRAEDNDLKREKLQLDIDAKREKIDIAKKGVQKKAKDQIRQQGSLSTAIDDFMANDGYMNAVSGWRGRTPAVSDTGVEAEAYFDNIKNNLTLENLDKMTGVLSETDIKILSTAATALQKGMSKKAITTEMKKIQDVLKTKSDSVQKQILEGVDAPAVEAAQQSSTQEGTTATNPQTGQKVIFTNGQWQPAT